jgi:hypothetical protein
MSQTVINAGGQAIGDAGDAADSNTKQVVSGFNQDAVQMPFGYGVRDGTAQGFYKLATGFSGVAPVTGVLLRRANYQPQITLPNGQTVGDLGASGLLQNAPLNIMRSGRVLVPVEAAVANGLRAWCRGVATGSLTAGSWLAGVLGGSGPATVGPSYCVDTSKQAVFRSASFTAADGTTLVAVLECDFTNSAY